MRIEMEICREREGGGGEIVERERVVLEVELNWSLMSQGRKEYREREVKLVKRKESKREKTPGQSRLFIYL